MIIRVTSTNRVLYAGISNRVLSNMTLDQLQMEAERVERDLRLWKQMTTGQPRHFRQTVIAEKRCLVSERERIERAIKRRRGAAIEQAFDAQDYAEVLAP
jgi:hypothetical protein